jgi:Uma2 family endonuclease
MSTPNPRQTAATIADWAGWEGRWELIQGVPYDMTPAPGVAHQRVSMQLGAALFTALEAAKGKAGGGGCEVFSAPIDLYLPGEQSVYQPDLVIVCDPAKITERGIEGVPDLVVEILSPSTAFRDLNQKRQRYEAAGVPEYLIVNPDEQAALLLRLLNGRYEDAASVAWGAAMALLAGRLAVTIATGE